MNNLGSETQVILDRIVEYCKPDKVILFGSFARGDQRNDSDIDLLIVKKSDKKRPFRIKEVFEAIRGLNREHPLDPIVYTPEEINKRIFMGDYFVKRIMEEGKVIYG